MEWNVSPERIARLKKVVPKGKITIVEMPKLNGEVIQPLSTREIGLPERKVA